MDIAKLDRFMQARPAQEEGVRWLAPFEPPLVLEGFAFFEQNGAYRRLPLDSDAVFSRAGRAALTELGTNTAGGCIRFRSSTGRVLVRARLAAACAMHHMPSTGQGGFDCYLRRPGAQCVRPRRNRIYRRIVERRGPGGKGISNSFSAVHGRERGMGGR